MTLEKFVYDEVPTVQLTKNKADNVKYQDFDDVNEKMEALEKKMRSDEIEFKKQQAKLREVLLKAEKEKAEQRRVFMDMIMRQAFDTIQKKVGDWAEEKQAMLDVHNKQLSEIQKMQNVRPEVVRK